MAETARQRLERRLGTTPAPATTATRRLAPTGTPIPGPFDPSRPQPTPAPSTAPRLAPSVKLPTTAAEDMAQAETRKTEAGRKKAEELFAPEKRGFVSKLASNIFSGAGGIAGGITGIPTFFGKVAQTGGGLVEGAWDLATGLVDEDLYRSQLETDLARGRAQGLEGEALLAYAGHRQFPIMSDYITSSTKTARNVAELATGGAYDYGTPGIDYADAYRRGELGRVLVEDLGNVILAGRATGAGNVVARAGAAVPGRTGRVISTTGRLIEEPIGTLARGAGVAVAAGASATNMPRLESAARRVATADVERGAAAGPLRQTVSEITGARRRRAFKQWEKYQKDINDLRDEQTALVKSEPDAPRIDEINDEIARIQDSQDAALKRTGLPKDTRDKVREGQIRAEALRSQYTELSAAYKTIGVESRSPEILRREAQNIENESWVVERRGNRKQAETMRAIANRYREYADLKEQYPGVLDGPIPKEASPAAHIIMDQQAVLVLDKLAQGFTPQQIADNLTSPKVSPDLEYRGYRYSAADIDYLARYLNGELNPAEMVAMNQVLALYMAWSEWFTEQQMAGRGRAEPLSSVALQTTPDPKKLIAEIGKYGGNGNNLLNRLDTILAQMVEQVAPGLLEQMKIDPDNPSGLYKRFANEPYDTPLYNLANGATKLVFDQLAADPNLGYILRDPLVYPANMQRVIEAENRFSAETRSAAIQEMLVGLREISAQFGDLLSEKRLAGITRLIDRLTSSPEVFSREAYNRVANRIGSLSIEAARRVEALQKRVDQLSQAELQLLDDLEFGVTLLSGLEAALMQIAQEPPQQSGRLRALEAEAQALFDEREALTAERQAISARLGEQQTEQQPRLETARRAREAVETEETTVRDQVATAREQLANVETELARVERLLQLYEYWSDPNNAPAVISDYQFLLDLEDQGVSGIPRRPTDQEVRAYKEERVREAVGETPIDALEGEVDQIFGTTPVRRNPVTKEGGVRLEGLLQEDFLAGVERILPNQPGRMWLKEFIDKYSSPDGRPLDEAASEASGRYYGEIVSGATAYTAKELSIEEWLNASARAFRRLKEAEERVKKAKRKSLKDYRTELENQLRRDDPREDYLEAEGQTQLRPAEVEALFKMLQDGPENARAQVAELRRQSETLNKTVDEAQPRLTELRDQVTELRRGETPQLEAPLLRRRGEIDTRLRQISKLEGPKKRSLKVARRKEPGEAIKAERARLRGIGVMGRPAPGAEGPSVGQVRPGLRTKVERRIARLEGQQAANVETQARLRAEQARLAQLEDQSTTLREEATAPVLAELNQPFGPQRLEPGTRTTYFPGGSTRNVRDASSVSTEMRSTGAAPQYKTQAERVRTTSLETLSFEETAQKISEITNAYDRHVIVEDILKDPEVTTNANRLLTPERVAALKEQARQQVLAQTRTPQQAGLMRTPAQIESVVQEQFGILLNKEIERLGYEPVSRVEVDPETFTHEAVGDMLESVPASAVDENTFLMRRGMRQRIVQQFVVKEATNIPESVLKVSERIGEATGAWKTMVLPFSLRWQIGDLTGNVINAWVRAEVPPNILIPRIKQIAELLQQDRRTLEQAVDLASSDPALQALLGAGFQARGPRSAAVAALRSPEANPRTTLSDVRLMFGPLKGLRAKAFKFNEWQNMVVRAAVAMEKLERRLSEQGRSIYEATPENYLSDPVIRDSVNEAVNATHKALGSFSELSPWEQRVIRRVYPFWAWIKFINHAAWTMAIDNPDRVLFTAALGNMVADPDDDSYFAFLQGTIPLAGKVTDLGFVNPYSDAVIFGENQISALQNQLTGISPVIRTPLKAGGLLAQKVTGWQSFPFEYVSQPSYLEGRPGVTQRDVGILAGELAYLALKDWGGPFRNILESLPSEIPLIAPQGVIVGTDVGVGPGVRFPQGSLRTGTSTYAQPRLSPNAQRLSAVMRAFGIPGAPIAEIARLKPIEERQARLDERARRRKEMERERALRG